MSNYSAGGSHGRIESGAGRIVLILTIHVESARTFTSKLKHRIALWRPPPGTRQGDRHG